MVIKRISVISVENFIEPTEPGVNHEAKVGRAPENIASYWNGLLVIAILGVCALFTSPQMLIPRQNTIFYQSNWMEPILFCGFVLVIRIVDGIQQLNVYFKEISLLSFKVFLRLYFWMLLGLLFPYIVAYTIWVLFMDFNHPMPFLGILCFFHQLVFWACGLWFLVPSDLLTNKEFRNKLKSYMKYLAWWFVMGIQKDVLSFAFKKMARNFQWIFALMLPVIRNGNKRILSRVVNEIAGHGDERSNFYVGLCVNTHYAFFVAIRLAGAETSAVLSILMIDFLLQIGMSYQIIHMKEKVGTKTGDQVNLKNEQRRAIMSLVLAEIVEGLVPLVYAMGFAMTYFGPNGHLIGNVLSSLWAYEKVEDVANLFQVLFIMFGMDCLSVLGNTYLVWKFGNVNLAKEFCQTLQKYWIMISILLAVNVTTYFGLNDINLGNDQTFKFTWITDEGRLVLISNSTELAEDEKTFLLLDPN